MSAGWDRPLPPLEMARNCVRAVLRYADYEGRDPLGSYIARSGQAGHQSAQLAGNMALVSIAEDMHLIVAIMTGHGPDATVNDPWAEPPGGGEAAAAWVRDNGELIRQAIFDASEYRREHGLPTTGREYDRLAEQFSEMTTEEGDERGRGDAGQGSVTPEWEDTPGTPPGHD